MTELNATQVRQVEQARAFAGETRVLVDTAGNRIERARRLFAAFARKGYHALLIPRQYGGKGMDHLSAGIIYETLSYGLPGTIHGPLTTAHCAFMIMSGAQNDVHADQLRKIARDCAPAGFCLTEESAGSDITAIRTVAAKESDSYTITGSKSIVINHAIARTFIVFAGMPPTGGRASLNAFVVEADLPGISLGDPCETLGFASGVMGAVVFHEVRTPKECLLGEIGSGYLLFMETLDKGRPLVAATCTGEALKALDLIIEYTKVREQFGKPLSSFQDISFSLAEHATRAHASRLLYRDALARIDSGRPFTQEASMAKLFAAETLMEIASFGMEMIGYRAVTERSELSGIYHDARLMNAIDGTTGVQKMVIASQL